MVPWTLSVMIWAVLHYVLRRESEKPGSPQALYSWVDIRSVEKAKRREKKKEEKRKVALMDVDRTESTGSERQRAESRRSMYISSAS